MAFTLSCPCVPSGSLFFQYTSTITATIVLISSGMHFGWPSPSLPLLVNETAIIHLTHAQGSWLAVMPSTGAVFGAVVGGSIVDIIGRKPCIMLLSPVYFAAWLAIAFTPYIIYLYIARFAVGIADGIAFTVFPMYIGEISDSKIRGLLGSSTQITILIGFLLVNVIGLNFPIKETALISATLPLLHLFTFVWMPESPYFLIMKGKRDKATSSLKTLKQLSDVDAEVSRLDTVIQQDKRSSGSFVDLWRVAGNRNALLVVCTLRFLQQAVGNIAIAFYCQMIFLEAGGATTASTATIIYFSVQVVIGTVSSVLVDKTGRIPLLMLSAVGSATALVIEGTYFYLKNETTVNLSSFSFVPLVALLFYIVVYNIGLQTIPTLLLGEVFPTSIKAFALCVADIIFSLSVAAISKYFQITKDEFGMHIPFFSFAVGSVILLLFVIFCVPETKGKTLEEVQLMFRNRSQVSNGDSEPLRDSEVNYGV